MRVNYRPLIYLLENALAAGGDAYIRHAVDKTIRVLRKLERLEHEQDEREQAPRIRKATPIV
jgi:hypothetical protein